MLRRVGLGWEALVVDAYRYSELVCRCSKSVIPLQRVCIRYSERLLPCDFWMCCIIIEMSYRNDFICLMRIECYDELMSDVRKSTLTYICIYIRVTLPTKA